MITSNKRRLCLILAKSGKAHDRSVANEGRDEKGETDDDGDDDGDASYDDIDGAKTGPQRRLQETGLAAKRTHGHEMDHAQ